MREVVFDTETTGFSVEDHRVIEIGCVELMNRLPTGRTFHSLVNPEREIDYDSVKIHGITNEKVKDAPKFADIAAEVLAFFGEDPLVAHNAEFDFTFVNRELKRCSRPPLTNEMRCSLTLAKSKLPGQRHNLDALCRYYNIDLSERIYHSALLDARLLADVYVELQGGLQATLVLEATKANGAQIAENAGKIEVSRKVVVASEDEQAAHGAFLAKFVTNSKWNSN